ncbi:hypothetical protein C8F04DRAFT_1269420 [Mycena alexandri]|uniref:Uncharacterized protein n=1 Tax=Mycena alexandri TaxID=1745969 RepID=A0AAD6SCG4_9AGAR|nr:hypothetical protein C8F04DRAFT_1269420 [Mycena alexandri]
MLSPGYSLLGHRERIWEWSGLIILQRRSHPTPPLTTAPTPVLPRHPPDPTSRPPGPASFLIRSTSLDDSTRLSTTPPALLPSPPASAPHALPLPAPILSTVTRRRQDAPDDNPCLSRSFPPPAVSGIPTPNPHGPFLRSLRLGSRQQCGHAGSLPHPSMPASAICLDRQPPPRHPALACRTALRAPRSPANVAHTGHACCPVVLPTRASKPALRRI